MGELKKTAPRIVAETQK